MERFLQIQSKLLPELIIIVEKRYNILKEIQHSQPIGRRNLAERLGEGERSIRNEMDFLKDLRLIEVTTAGATLTDAGHELLADLVDYIKVVKGLSDLEREVQRILGISQVLLVPDSHEAEYNRRDLGRFAANKLKKIIVDKVAREGQITIAVTGGTTVGEVANTMEWDGKKRPVTVVPGRGGLGEDVEIQANTIASLFAKKLGGSYRMLHVPDNLQEATLHSLIQEPQIKEVLELVDTAKVLIHGVGTAEEMAKRRGLAFKELELLEAKGAVGEAFGFYFNEAGEIVYTTTSVGLKLDDLERNDLLVIAIAQGTEKARAILSVVSPDYHDILITDEKTAQEMLEIYQQR